VFVKICGVTREEDALLAVAVGADAVGFVFAPSRRQVAPTLVRDIIRRLPSDILTVGVFRDEARSRVIDIVNTTGVKAVQLHGHESVEDVAWVAERVPFVVKAFGADDPARSRSGRFPVTAVLLDSTRPGSGTTFDWSVAARHPRDRRLILAGGLSPDNVAEAVAAVRPWGVDVSTGVEASWGESGQKDGIKMKAFVDRARAAGAALPEGADSEQPIVPYDWMSDDMSEEDAL